MFRKKTHLKIKIYAERNTGTAYLEWLLQKNLKVELLDGIILGWKRRIAPQENELIDAIKKEVLFICLIKNPYSWLLSMHRNPVKHEVLKKVNLSDFLKYSFGDYRTPIDLWNNKNASYLNLQNYVERHLIIMYEDLLSNPEEVISSMAQKFEFKKRFSRFKNQDNYISEKGIKSKKFHRKYYLTESWKKEFTKNDIEFINSRLDHNLMQQLNYQIIESK